MLGSQSLLIARINKKIPNAVGSHVLSTVKLWPLGLYLLH